MNALEREMVEILRDLRETHHALGVKAEFEAEGSRYEEVARLKDIASQAALELTIKIGGCEAITDMREARILGVSHIVAPMIETPYALRKYVEAGRQVFSGEDTGLLCNIETITGFENLRAMAESESFAQIRGIVLGRVDMSGSLGLSREDINGARVLEIATDIALLCEKMGKELVVGGGISSASVPFLTKLAGLPLGTLTRFETRKVIFSASALEHSPESALEKAVRFELAWLRNKRDYYRGIYEEDRERIAMLEDRYAYLRGGQAEARK